MPLIHDPMRHGGISQRATRDRARTTFNVLFCVITRHVTPIGLLISPMPPGSARTTFEFIPGIRDATIPPRTARPTTALALGLCLPCEASIDRRRGGSASRKRIRKTTHPAIRTLKSDDAVSASRNRSLGLSGFIADGEYARGSFFAHVPRVIST